MKEMQERARFTYEDCPICGKPFCIPDSDIYVYKLRNRGKSWYTFYCSWTCYRIAEKEKEEQGIAADKRRQKKKRRTNK